MFRLLGSLIMFGAIAAGGYWTWNNVPEVRHFVMSHLAQGTDFATLEVRYSAEQIMEKHRPDLLKDKKHVYGEPELLFYPYALMEVKYTDSDKSTREAVILWGLEDGEMVIDTSTWEKSHGFEDCLNASADRNDYRIVTTLAAHGNSMNRVDLANALYVQEDVLDMWLESCRRKKLIVQSGNEYRLHFQSPKLEVRPETRINQSMVTKSVKGTDRVPRHYSIAQVEKGVQAAFGNDFTIRRTTEVFLPVHRIEVHNPDGSVFTSCWNALNGSRVQSSNFIH